MTRILGSFFTNSQIRSHPFASPFITSRSPASASELVINGLHPHIDAVMVGGNTYGKQVGQGRWDLHELEEGLEREDCDVALRLTAFEIVNGENEGGYHQVGLGGTGRFTLCAARTIFQILLGTHRRPRWRPRLIGSVPDPARPPSQVTRMM
ncbi:MAG: hypothetical protein CM15mP103_07270 [Gammaproteobacteria bacterium]|nr:MAG: hypothetical protein CM15mP103_07270 [Gammaproteobacteria bacterium]